MILPNENTLLRYGEQYEAAGWEATFRAMAIAGEVVDREHPDLAEWKKPPLDKILCLAAFKNTADIVPLIVKSTFDFSPSAGCVPLTNSRMCTENGGQLHLDPDVMNAHSLYHDRSENIYGQIFDKLRLDRFEELIIFYSQYYAEHIIQSLDVDASTSQAISEVQHHTAFYIGLEDPEIQ